MELSCSDATDESLKKCLEKICLLNLAEMICDENTARDLTKITGLIPKRCEPPLKCPSSGSETNSLTDRNRKLGWFWKCSKRYKKVVPWSFLPMSRLRQFWLLLWKNYVLQKRQPWVTLLELGAPTLFAAVLLLVRTKVNSTYISNPKVYSPFSVTSIPVNVNPGIPSGNGSSVYHPLSYFTPKLIIYAPECPHTSAVMKEVGELSKLEIAGFKTEQDMINDYETNYQTQGKLLGAVVFASESPTSQKFGDKIKVKIRFKFSPTTIRRKPTGPMPSWMTELSFPVFQKVGPRNPDANDGGNPGYENEGFLFLQHIVSLSIAMHLRGNVPKSDIPDIMVAMERFPYPPYNDDDFLLAMKLFFPLALMLSFIYPSLNIVKSVVIEKEKRLKESMKMMGLSNWLHWSAWFLKYLLFLTISLVIVTFVITVRIYNETAVLLKSDPMLVFTFLLVYTVATISFCFMISTLFSKANSAAAGAGIIFFLAFIPYFIIFPRYDTMGPIGKILACLLSNTALTMGAMVITMWEGTGAGARWENFHLPVSQEDSLSLWVVTSMLLLDSVLYLTLAWYIEAVFPGEYGIPQPWYFPFVKSYWCTSYVELDSLISADENTPKSEFFEKDPEELMNGISIIGLSKVFSKKKVAVSDVSLNMFKGQITALLGHNGAGKTTIISMLTGLFPPTTGTAIVNSHDVRTDIEGVHGSLGICPQHDILFDTLTVEEHLYFFSKLKGYLPDLVDSEVERMLKALNLEDKRKALAKTLSGGMKRRLSVGIALCGGSQVVMLDEPTSGMDPAARRFTWDLLLSEKEDRTILLTTHFMEEADILGDRIAIMAEGEVRCSGSPLFLKKKYGAGYHLVLVKDRFNCNDDEVISLVMKHVPAAELESNIGAEMSFSLPHESSHDFPALFRRIESSKGELGLTGYGASITTMEEVFLRVGEYSKEGISQLSGKPPVLDTSNSLPGATNPVYGLSSNIQDSGVYECTGYPTPQKTIIQCDEPVEFRPVVSRNAHSLWQQFKALFIKSVLHSFRNWLLTSSQIFLPVVVIAVTLTILKTLPKPQDSPERVLDLSAFRGTTIPYIRTPDVKDFTSIYTQQFESKKDTPELVSNVTGQELHKTLIDSLVSKGKSDLPYYNSHCILALVAEKNDTTLHLRSLFNNQAFHSPAISLAALDNALLRYITGNNSLSLTVSNHPLPRTISEQSTGQQNQGTEAYQVAQDLMFAMSFLMASFAPFLVRERSTKSKHLQRVSGVNLRTFWASTYLWHFINYLVPCFLVLLEFLAFNTKALNSPEQIGRLLLVFILHGLASLPMIYCLSFLFNVSSTAYTRLTLINFIAGIACLLSVTILEIPLLELQHIARYLDWTFSAILPQFCLGRSLYNLYQNYQFLAICGSDLVQAMCNTPLIYIAKPCCKGKCEDDCLPWNKNYLAWEIPGIGRLLFFMGIQCIVYNLMLVGIELDLMKSFKNFLWGLAKRKVQPTNQTERPVEATEQLTELPEDGDVLEEQRRIDASPFSELVASDTLIARELTKCYSDGLLAVDKLSFGIHRGECFGLLGLNGAGKTTTFKMLTGDEEITGGDAFISGFSVKNEIRKVQQELGYCPQYDALIDQMTGYETLTLFARLRGVGEENIPAEVVKLSKLLYFNMHLHKLVKDYSGGNKRKLSTAVALIGNSPLVFLDEPTTGMDPVARRYLWDAILRVVRDGRSIVLTSHSMEECEALCSRLVIMVNGRFCCLGSPQYLKNKFGEGFTLMVKVGHRSTAASFKTLPRPSVGAYSLRSFGGESALTDFPPPEVSFRHDIEQVQSFISTAFPSAELRSMHQGLLHYQVPKYEHSWAEMFETMEEAKAKFNIENYSVGETTLEQVFLNFARVQRQSEDS